MKSRRQTRIWRSWPAVTQRPLSTASAMTGPWCTSNTASTVWWTQLIWYTEPVHTTLRGYSTAGAKAEHAWTPHTLGG